MSEASPRNSAISECAPAAAPGTPPTPAGVRIVVPLLPGGVRFRSPPAKLPAALPGRPDLSKYVFMKSIFGLVY